MNITNDYVNMEKIHRIGIINGKKVLDENKIEYETPYEKKIQGIKNGKKYAMIIQKKPKQEKRVTFRVWNPMNRNNKIERTLTPYYSTNNNKITMKNSSKCKTIKKRRNAKQKKQNF